MPTGENVSNTPHHEPLDYAAAGATSDNEIARLRREAQHGIQQHGGLDALDEIAYSQAEGLPSEYQGEGRRRATVGDHGTHYMTGHESVFVPASDRASAGSSVHGTGSESAPQANRPGVPKGRDDKGDDEDWWTE